MAEMSDEPNSSSEEQEGGEVDPDVLTEKEGPHGRMALHIKPPGTNGSNTYVGVYKLAPNRWMAKMWLPASKSHRMIGEFGTQEDAAYAYAVEKKAMEQNGNHPSRGPASSHRATTTASQRHVPCKKHARCTREDRHRGICKLSLHRRQRVQPERESRSAAARAEAPAAAAAPPRRGSVRPVRQSAGPTPPGSASSAHNRAAQSPASAPGSTSTGKFAIDCFKETMMQLKAGLITEEEAQEYFKIARNVA